MAGGGKLGETLAQPLTSVSSSNGVSARTVELSSSFIGGFLHLSGAALFLGPCSFGGLAGSTLQAGNMHGVLASCLGVRGLLVGQPPRLHARRGERQSQRDSGSASNHLVTAFWLTLAAR